MTRKTTQRRSRTSAYYLLASRYRPLKPAPLEHVLWILVKRQSHFDALKKQRSFAGWSDVSLTMNGLMEETGLTRKQVRDALETLREAGLITFKRQHHGKRGWGRSFYDCRKLVTEVENVRAATKRRRDPREEARLDHDLYMSDVAAEQEREDQYDEYVREILDECLSASDLAFAHERAEQEAYTDQIAEESALFEEHDFHATQRALWGARTGLDPDEWTMDPIPRRRPEFIEADRQYCETFKEEMAQARRDDWLEHLIVEGPMLAVMGIPGYAEALATHFPDEFARLFGASETVSAT